MVVLGMLEFCFETTSVDTTQMLIQCPDWRGGQITGMKQSLNGEGVHDPLYRYLAAKYKQTPDFVCIM